MKYVTETLVLRMKQQIKRELFFEIFNFFCRALWYHEESYPCSWQLDPTEGPFRMRKRLQRCHLEIAPKFFLDEAPAKSNSQYYIIRVFSSGFQATLR